MAGTRAFDDDRWPDQEMFANCCYCGKKVDPRDPRRGTHEEAPAGPQLPIHLACADNLTPARRTWLYHRALNEMARHARSQCA